MRDHLLVWLGRQPTAEAVGPAYGVFGNGPFLPGFMKRFSILPPVQRPP